MKIEKDYLFTVGELADLAGVTVRTLQYYDQADLLHSEYNDSHKRVYHFDDLLRLQQILFLRSLGFSLKDIGGKLLKQENAADLENVFEGQREILLDKIRNLNKIVETLDLIISETKAGQQISMNRLTAILQLMNRGNPYSFIVHYFTDEQLKRINTRVLESPEKQAAAQRVFSRLDSLYHKGADPAGKEGQELAGQWWDLVCDFASGDPELFKALLSAGQDLNNWPEYTREIRKSIEEFLSKALYIYMNQNGICLEELEAEPCLR